MSRVDAARDPGDPSADDEEAVEAELVEDEPVAPEVAAVEDLSDDPEGSARLQAELAERTEDLQRVTAEFSNYRRRADRERTAGAASAKAAVLAELLPIVDDLERARQHGDLEQGPFKSFADRLQSVLASQGVEEFGAEGDPFDPALHEAVQDESEGADPVLGTVLRKGYRVGDRTLRTAMVVVTGA